MDKSELIYVAKDNFVVTSKVRSTQLATTCYPLYFDIIEKLIMNKLGLLDT